MRDGASPPEDKGPETPAWVVSFTDMITLLLAFFVLLQAFAVEQHPDLFFQGQGSFRRHVAGMGIPDVFFGKERRVEAEQRKRKHPTEESQTRTRARVIDPENEQIRKVFRDLQTIETKTSKINVYSSNVILTPIRFGPSEVSLDAPAREYLGNLAINLRQNVDKDNIKIYVVGSAADAPRGPDRWLISARRAKAVGDFMSKALAGEADGRSWRIIAWGAGDGQGQRPGHDATARRKFIRIAIVEVE